MFVAFGRVSGALSNADTFATGMLCLLAVGLTAAKQGAVLPTAWGWSALGLLVATALGLAFRHRVELSRLEWGVLAGLASVLLWIALSTFWSASSPRTVDELERSIIYLAALAALFVLGSPKSPRYLFGGLLAAIVNVSTVALVIRFTGPAENLPLAGSLPSWNALGFLTAIGLILALEVTSAQLPRVVRLGAVASLPLLATTLYFTHSRGAFFALGVGLFVFAFLHPILGGRRRIAAVGVVVLAVGVLGVGVVRAGGPGALLETTYESFRSPPAPRGEPSERLFTLSSNARLDYWRIAWAQYRAHPWLGSGSGTFALYWNRDRETIYYARDAHNLYLETVAELGPVGLLLLVGTLALPFRALRRASREPLLAAAVGAYVAFLVHAGIEWDWEVPAVTLAGLFCGGSLVLAARSGRRRVSGAGRAVALLAIVILAAFTLVAYRGNSAAQASRKAIARGEFKRAEETARTATRWLPWSSEAWLSLGEAKLGLGDVRGARSSFRTGLGMDPREWRLWYQLARASKGAERERALAEAARLNQFSREVRALRAE